MRLLCLSLAILGSAFAGPALADSPLSSSNLSSAYLDIPEVSRAKAGASTPGDRTLLLSTRPFDEKLALLDVLGWGQSGLPRELFVAIAGTKAVPIEDLAKKDLSPEEKAILGYALAMADIWTLKPLGVGNDLQMASPEKLLDEAARARKDDFAIAFAHALVKAQGQMSKSFCRVWKTTSAVLKRFPSEKRNLRAAAVDEAVAYLALYRDDCEDERPPAAERKEVDEVNALEIAGAHVVVATQGGIVVLKASTLEHVGFHADAYCFRVLAWEAKAIVSCDSGAWLVDGASFKKVWTLEGTVEGGLHLWADGEGRPLLKDRRTWARWTGARFERTSSPLPPDAHNDPYDVLVRGGEVWAVDFLKRVVRWRDGRPISFALGSDSYPGRDPREFVVDASGDLWVLDFMDGLMRYDRARDVFVQAPILTDQAAGIVIDQQGRMVVVHYRQGATVVERDKVRALDTTGLDFLRGPVLLPDGSVLVGGAPGIMRFSLDGPGRGERRSLRRAPGR